MIPVFRDRETLDQAVDSVLGQSFKPEAIVLVWDGGDAETLERARQRQREWPELIRLIEQPNLGLGAARNTGIRSLETDWIALLDADDFWLPEKLEHTAKILLQNPKIDFLYHSIRLIDSRGPGRIRPARKVLGPRDLLAHGSPIAPSAVLFKRSSFDRLGGFLEGLEWLGVEDLDFWVRALVEKFNFEGVQQPLTAYRTGGMSSNLEEHLERVDRLMRTRFSVWGLTPSELEAGLKRKRYEKARALHASSRFREAVQAYSEFRSEPLCFMFRLAARLGVRV